LQWLGTSYQYYFGVVAGIAYRFIGNPILVLVVTVNTSLAVFNMLPIPPLDGHHILGLVFSKYQTWSNSLMQGYGFVIMILVIFFAGSFIAPAASLLSRIILG
jgi:Zn-dependent protease